MKRAILMMAMALLPLGTNAGDFLVKGYIQNHIGKKCWYKQKKLDGQGYFHQKGLMGGTHVLTFDVPTCMSGDELEISINKMMINNIITAPYSHADAKFKTRESELYNSSDLQVKGQCIQSETYPAIGVAVDYVMANNSITKVYHSTALQGCKNK